MGHIKEPIGVDFMVDPMPLTIADRERISKIIAHYKATGKKMTFQKSKALPRGQKRQTHLANKTSFGRNDPA